MTENPHQRKKEPQIIRQSILQHAMQLAAQKGVNGVSIQAVADLVGVTKGGVFHHFPNKQKLLESMVICLLEQLDVVIDRLIAEDDQSYGCFTRAYIEITLEKQIHGLKHSWSAISMTMLTDKTFNEYWIDWLNARLQCHAETDADMELKILRYAADGIWLTMFTEVEDVSETSVLKKELIARTYRAKAESFISV
ncbi:TetR family transcriptional regulator [Acinetobacter sp. ANC 5054]|uniref:TetR/AcrR family transcriptional regulator n=1 Tax=Acinetobacter sp. ANC 5054 TaxID=1977877 RepID=UPI000A339C31|nr:TetR/AcrR family transcriptional regulator [Acinetobacter sp. ANC 5054]OTG81956.1 TetR family transcriptional regulator [Acinetobacter sp. ANC 5054]